jgi:hypothetical protein
VTRIGVPWQLFALQLGHLNVKSMLSIAKREGRPPAACDPGPLANWKEKESKPASRAKTKEVMADWDSPLGAAVQIDDLFCL